MPPSAPRPGPAGCLVALLVPLGAAIAALVLVRPEEGPPPAWPSYADVFEAVAPGVVNVHLDGPRGRMGTGFAVGPDRVVTAWHLVAGADVLEIRDLSGRTLPATVVGTDARVDLALLRLDGAGLQPLPLGSAASLRVGDTVVAVGNPYGLGHTLSAGILAQRGRLLADGSGPRVDFLQLSMPLHPGNSGGPVLDAAGRVVGVLTGTHSAGQGIAFAVPAEVLRRALPALSEGRRVSRAFLGIRTEPSSDGLRVVSVSPSSPADLAGIRPGDRLERLAGHPLRRPADVTRVLDALEGGDVVPVEIERDGRLETLEVALADQADQPVVVGGMTLAPRPGTGGEVVAVRPRSRAEGAGIEVGDLVRAVDDAPVHAPAEVKEALARSEAARVELVRDGAALIVELPVGGGETR